MKDRKNNVFLRKVLILLEGMGEIKDKLIDNKVVGLYKDEVLFGLIKESDLFLRNDVNNLASNTLQENINFQKQNYAKVKNGLYIKTNNKDNILLAATNAYWIASGKVQANKKLDLT